MIHNVYIYIIIYAIYIICGLHIYTIHVHHIYVYIYKLGICVL